MNKAPPLQGAHSEAMQTITQDNSPKNQMTGATSTKGGSETPTPMDGGESQMIEMNPISNRGG